MLVRWFENERKKQEEERAKSGKNLYIELQFILLLTTSTTADHKADKSPKKVQTTDRYNGECSTGKATQDFLLMRNSFSFDHYR